MMTLGLGAALALPVAATLTPGVVVPQLVEDVRNEDEALRTSVVALARGPLGRAFCTIGSDAEEARVRRALGIVR